MGRKAGVAAGETRAALLDAAARVFAGRGYDAASISDITSEAGLTSGAVYAHYSSKAELFVATVKAYGDRDLDRLLGGGGAGLPDSLGALGSGLDQREPTEESLLVSAVVAARRHPEVATLLSAMFTDREAALRSLVVEAQSARSLTDRVSAAGISRLSMVIAMGSLVVGALGLEPVEHGEWATLVSELVGAFRGPA